MASPSFFTDIDVANLSNDSREYTIGLYIKGAVVNGSYSMLIGGRPRGCGIISLTVITSSGTCKVTAEYGPTYLTSEDMIFIPGLKDVAASGTLNTDLSASEETNFVTDDNFFQVTVSEAVDCWDLHIQVLVRHARP